MRIVESQSNSWSASGRGWAAVLGLLLALAGVACGGLPKIHYYTLPIPPPPEAGDPKTNLILGVEPFRAVEVLRDDRIVYFESPTQLNFYEYHRWSSNPATMLTDLTIRRMNMLGEFAGVRILPSRAPVDYVLRGRLLNFDEVDFDAQVKGRVVLELSLLRSRDNALVWSGIRQAESVAEGKGVPAVASALSAASGQLLDATLPLLVAAVERDVQRGSNASPQ